VRVARAKFSCRARRHHVMSKYMPAQCRHRRVLSVAAPRFTVIADKAMRSFRQHFNRLPSASTTLADEVCRRRWRPRQESGGEVAGARAW